VTRTALITGAAAGIGAAAAERLEAEGWRAIRLARRWPDGEPENGITLDLRDHEALREAVASLRELDALVNNAAVMPEGPLTDLDAAAVAETLAVNLTAAIVGTAAAVPALAARGGAIVNVASVHALASRTGVAAYAASKGGLVAFTRAAAVELGREGVRVNAVVPGAVDTKMLMPDAEGGVRDDGLAALAARTPLGRIGQPAEIAEAIAFLADSARSSFITGEALVADGGALARLSTE